VIGVSGVSDPRTSQLYHLYHNGSKASQPFAGAVLVFARWDTKPPNTILGIPGSFTDDQIIAALKRFYQEWRPPKENPSAPRPKIILAAQNWGSGATLYDPLKSLSAEFQVDIYMLYPVVTYIEPQQWHPTPNDKRLSELIPPAVESTSQSK
jgi:hypothetical protein